MILFSLVKPTCWNVKRGIVEDMYYRGVLGALTELLIKYLNANLSIIIRTYSCNWTL